LSYRERILSKIGLMALVTALALSSGVACAADKIYLVCSGTISGSSPEKPAREDTGESIIIDLDQGIVIWGEDTLHITSNVGNTIEFKSRPGQTFSSGVIDRVLGKFFVTESIKVPGKKFIVRTYYLTCKPAKPLF
jgi:hypothetical protein